MVAAFLSASALLLADSAQPEPPLVTTMVLNISTPDVRSTALSTVTSPISESTISIGFSFQNSSLRCNEALLVSLSRVNNVAPDVNTNRRGVLSTIDIGASQAP